MKELAAALGCAFPGEAFNLVPRVEPPERRPVMRKPALPRETDRVHPAQVQLFRSLFGGQKIGGQRLLLSLNRRRPRPSLFHVVSFGA